MEDRKYKVDLYLYDRPLIINPIEFYQNDTESCAIEFNFNTDRVNKFDLTNKTVEVRVTKPDLTTITDSATITGLNTAVWELKLGAISISGSCSISIYVYQNTERLTFGTLKYKVIADREVGNVGSQPEYPILTQVIAEVQGAVNESNQTNDNISVMEQQRAEIESARNLNEQQRITNEDNRKIAEQQRQQNETTRNSEFNSIKSEYTGIKGIMIDTNNAANLQNQVNQVNTQLAETTKVVNVKNFGAKGDGVTDDTVAIQNAINQLKQGDVLYFPSPQSFYKITMPINSNAIFQINKPQIKIMSVSQNGIIMPIIKVLGDNVNKNATIFEILSNGIEVENISIWGGESGNKRVGEGFRTGTDFQSKLKFKNVFVAHCFNSGYNLTTYFTSFTECEARFISNDTKTGSGFKIHGRLSDGLEGTTINFIGCFTDYTDVGYDLSYLTYSQLSGCGCDHSTEVSYKLYRCYEVAGTGIGTEAIYKKALLLDTCLNVEFSGFRVIPDPTKDNSYAITLKSSTNCSVKKIRLTTQVFAEIIYGSMNYVEVPNIITNVVDNTYSMTGYETYQHKIIPVIANNVTETITANKFYELIQDTDTSGNSSIKQLLKHIHLEKDYTLIVSLPSTYTVQTQSVMKRIKGVRGSKSLIIKGENTDKNLNLMDVGTNGNFNIQDNEAEIVFENITFYSYYQGNKMFTIKNSTVRFKNCVIRTIGGDITYVATNIFNLENSKVIIESNTQILGTSVNNYAIKDNLSYIEFIKPTGCLPKNYEYNIQNPTVAGTLRKIISETCLNVKVRNISTAYAVDDVVIIGTGLYRCTTAGTSSSGTVTEASTIIDGTVVWAFVSYAPLKLATIGLTVTTSDYLLIDGQGLFKVTVAGTIDTMNDVSGAVINSGTVLLSNSGVRVRKVAMYGLLTV